MRTSRTRSLPREAEKGMYGDHASKTTAGAGNAGQLDSPSSWPGRLPLILLAAAGFAVALYLALYQFRILDRVWDPVFGSGSRRVLNSPLSRWLPVPDAALGAAAYLAEMVTEFFGGERRYRESPWLPILYGLELCAFAAASLGLVL